jgi:hypothetical protein
MSFKSLEAFSLYNINKTLKDFYNRVTGLSNRVKTLEASSGYKSFVTLLSQSGTDAPVPIVLGNSLNVVPASYYNSVGSFILHLDGVLAENAKVFLVYPSLHNGNFPNDGTVSISASPGVTGIDINIYVMDLNGVGKNSAMSLFPLEIRVYD